MYNIVPGFAIQRSDSVIDIYNSFKNILVRYDLSQETAYSFMCYTVEPGHLSILNIQTYIYQPQIPSPSLSTFALATKSLFSVTHGYP